MYMHDDNLPVKLKPFVLVESIARPFGPTSHLATTTQVPQSKVRRNTVEPASSPMPMRT
jgi:hypothetical protein